MGHMLNQTEMDIIIRWRRMSGDKTLWVPGTDHASIATQMMVERQLASEGKKRQDLGREKFLERTWEWKRHYGGAILEQMKRLGRQSTGSASTSRWTKTCRARCARPSSGSTKMD